MKYEIGKGGIIYGPVLTNSNGALKPEIIVPLEKLKKLLEKK